MSTKESDAIRNQQIQEARRRATLTLANAQSSRQRNQPKTSSLKGHEAFLKALELNNAVVRIEKMSTGEIIVGTVKHSDKFTVTIKASYGGSKEQYDRVVFKHDISEFTAMTPKAEAA